MREEKLLAGVRVLGFEFDESWERIVAERLGELGGADLRQHRIDLDSDRYPTPTAILGLIREARPDAIITFEGLRFGPSVRRAVEEYSAEIGKRIPVCVLTGSPPIMGKVQGDLVVLKHRLPDAAEFVGQFRRMIDSVAVP